MRVLLVSQQFPPDTALGGIGTQAAAKVAGLTQLGHEVHVLSRAGASGRSGPSQPRPDGVRVTRMPAPPLDAHTELAGWMAMSVQVAEWVDRLQDLHGPFDLLDIPEYGAEGLVTMADRTEWHRLPVAVQVHGTTDMLSEHLGWPERGSVQHRIGSAMEREAMRMADLLYASSTFSARWVEQTLGRPVGSVPVWHCGVDTRRFVPGAASEGPPTVVFVGRVAAAKGVDVLLRAAAVARARIPDLRVRLIGPADDAGRALVASHVEGEAEGLVAVCGPVPREDLPAHLAGATVFASPSAFEAGPGLVYLEAMACGVPVIASDVGGVGEVVRPGVTGLLVPPGDEDALAGAIVDVVHDPQRSAALSASARRWVVEHADTSALMPSLVALYERVTT